ncbi:MAG: hypothetical protein HY788_14325 [Deltaproteobacteria bacterium]|nr:hypothetical protein [Deltaproteobacteria bacterium]
MDCKKVERHILEMDSTVLNERTDPVILGHIKHCPECKASYDLVTTLRQAGPARTGSVEPDWDHFVRDVRNRLLAEACHPEKGPWVDLERFLAWFSRPRYAYGAVAVALLAVFVIMSPRIMKTGRYLFTADSAVGRPISSNVAAMPISFPLSTFDDHVSVPLENLSQEELVYLCNGLLSRLARQERLDKFQDVFVPDMEMTDSARYVSALESRLSNLSPAELTRVAHSLDYMMSN